MPTTITTSSIVETAQKHCVEHVDALQQQLIDQAVHAVVGDNFSERVACDEIIKQLHDVMVSSFCTSSTCDITNAIARSVAKEIQRRMQGAAAIGFEASIRKAVEAGVDAAILANSHCPDLSTFNNKEPTMQFRVEKQSKPALKSRPWAVIATRDDGSQYVYDCYRSKRRATEVRDAFAAADR